MIDLKSATASNARRFTYFTETSSEGWWQFTFENGVDTSLPENEQIDAVFRLGTVSYCNTAYAKMYGYTPEELVGRQLLYLFERNKNNIVFVRQLVRNGFRWMGAESDERDRNGLRKRFRNNIVGVLEQRDGVSFLVEAFGTQVELKGKRDQKEVRAASGHSIFGSPVVAKKWPQVFVLMPFKPGLKAVFSDHIKKVARDMTMSVGRADDFSSIHSIVREIWTAINNADIVIADCTGKNANVFYEIGIAHALGKDTILITQSLRDVPFDLQHMRVIQYKFVPRGMERFEGDLRRVLETIIQSHGDKAPGKRKRKPQMGPA